VTAAVGLSRRGIAWRAAQDLEDGMYVNLGVGVPTEITPSLVPSGREVVFQSENGALGVGALAAAGQGSPDLVNASQQRVTLVPGGCFFGCGDSFMMLRGAHVDVALLGAFQVSERGDLASWTRQRQDAPPAVGGAMDIAVGARAIWVLMEHRTKPGEPRLVRRCSHPLTAPGVVRRIYTDLAVVDVGPHGFVVRESLPELPFEMLQAWTEAPLLRAPEWRALVVPDAFDERGEREA
jgi:3-oxoacid CoA-transferase B subunit